MPAGAKLSVVALLAVTLLAWGLVATTPSVERSVPTAQASEPDPEAVPPPERAPAPVPVPEPAPTAKPPRAPTPVPPPPAPPAPGTLDDPERGSPAVDELSPAAAAEEARERDIARNAARYDAAHERFASEPRDEAWAAEQERTLNALVEEARSGELLDGIACKSSMCQVRLRLGGPSAAQGIVKLGTLAHALDPERVLRNEGPPDQRSMIIYLPRDGHWPDVPTEDPAIGTR
jgi:hypothetical protein